jgi:hypothetical protein
MNNMWISQTIDSMGKFQVTIQSDIMTCFSWAHCMVECQELHLQLLTSFYVLEGESDLISADSLYYD